ncbi:MAG: RNA-binding transcriptional accessory protein, partial [Anaerolineae bacterium]|nr:RNA-binding transcriptional accessory protein [Anaerolineae bacterium]
MPIEQTIAQNLQLHPASVKATIALLDEGQTVPFLARYRKEVTGGLDEDQLRQVAATVERLRALEGRRAAVLATIEEQGKLTEELRSQLLEAQTLAAVEDLYQPYRPKRRTRAGIARERGLQPLADLILEQPRTRTNPAAWAGPHVSDRVPTVEDAWAGARDVVAETVSDDPEVRGPVRERASRWGMIGSARVPDAEDPRRVYETYYEFEARADRLRPYQVLALNRGEAEKVLRVSLEVAERDWRAVVERRYRPDSASPLATMLADAIEDGVHRLLLPAIERDVRRALTENAEEHAIGVFAANLRSLLSQPPVSGHTVLGIDPGFRTGCKVAVVDPTGRVLETAIIYPHAPQKRAQEAQASLVRLIRRHGVSLLAIGNGTASRETEQLAAEVIRAVEGVKYVMVSEAGASVYSASPEARAEMPDLDVTLRGAVSIARRLQDPLAELVKIDPKSIGVGMYQHDVDQKRLEEALSAEVETVVNRVGVDVNTASAALLERVAGIGP